MLLYYNKCFNKYLINNIFCINASSEVRQQARNVELSCIKMLGITEQLFKNFNIIFKLFTF